MAKVHISNVTVLDNPSSFLNPFQFEITFECTEDLATGKSTKGTKTVCNITSVLLL